MVMFPLVQSISTVNRRLYVMAMDYPVARFFNTGLNYEMIRISQSRIPSDGLAIRQRLWNQ
jgi:hypothetical protein